MAILHTLINISTLLTLILAVSALHSDDEESQALKDFFAQLDDNRDGQVDETEAKKFIGERIGGQEYDTAKELTEAFHHMVTNIDTDHSTTEKTISEAEVKKHLDSLQHAVSVKEWVEHGLGLAQYAERFRQNVITAADFPLLVKDDGNIFEKDLGISSQLHRNQIVRGMKRLMLGLGELPSAPEIVSCTAETDCRTTLKWRAPRQLGNPAVHKYLIEGQRIEHSSSTWTVSTEVDAYLHQQTYTAVADHAPERYHFRIVAWTAYGPSVYAYFDPCHLTTGARTQPASIKSRDSVEPTVLQQHQPSLSNIAKTAEDVENGSGSTSLWTILVIAVSIGIRVLTKYNIARINCCLLSIMEDVASKLRLESAAEQIRKIKRNDCQRCAAKRREIETTTATESQHPQLDRVRARSHIISQTPHFDTEERHLVLSKSSPALGDAKTEYSMTEWNPIEAATDISQMPLPDYTTTSWNDKEITTPLVIGAGVSEVSPGVRRELIEGHCAFDGCEREWTGVWKLKNRWSRHFCSMCQLTYCYEHTHYSPHGSFGYCGQQSSCVCVDCFYRKLPPHKQAELDKKNTLDKSSSHKMELERGCCRRDGRVYVRSFLGIKRRIHSKSCSSSNIQANT